MSGGDTRVDVILVAYGPEPLLGACLNAILSSFGVSPRILLVDNGCTNPVIESVATRPDIKVVTMGTNVGFAGGVMEASTRLEGTHVALVNSDAILEPDCLRRLAATLVDERIGIAMPMILRRSDGRINSAGNPLHVLGYSWAGKNGMLAGLATGQDVAVASGAALMLSRGTWDRLGGFAPEFFLYHEDVDLSVACHQAELRVVLEPTATAHHDYSWDRNAGKLELAERNRLIVLLTRYPRALLLRLLPILLTTEIGALILGGLPGSRRAKLKGHVWLFRNRAWILSRRRENLARAVEADGFVSFLTARFDDAAPKAGRGPALLNAILPAYLRLVGFPLHLTHDRTTR